jgi:hypothetical protein
MLPELSQAALRKAAEKQSGSSEKKKKAAHRGHRRPLCPVDQMTRLAVMKPWERKTDTYRVPPFRR